VFGLILFVVGGTCYALVRTKLLVNSSASFHFHAAFEFRPTSGSEPTLLDIAYLSCEPQQTSMLS